jgi:YidC/Oxa1 family membrane protein insertase
VPLALKQYRSMRALAAVAPELKKVQDKWKHDKQRQQQEVMRFYQENKVNPLASCLPLVAQLPVFFALFYLLQDDLRTEICNQTARPCHEVAPGSADFLFIPDLTDEASGAVLVTLILIYVSSQLLSSVLMPATVDRTQRLVFTALPILAVPFIINFPAGLILYWITTNLWTVSQTVALRRIVGPPMPPPTTPGAPGGGILGGLLSRGGGMSGNGASSDGDGARGSAAAGAPRGRRRDRGGAVSAGKAAGREGHAGGGEAPEPSGGARAAGAKPPPPPRKRKKRSGRRR